MSDARAFDFLGELVQANILAALAIIAVLLVRGSVRRIAGAHAAYLLWLIVPAVFAAALVPARMGAPQIITLPADSSPSGMAGELVVTTDTTTYPEALNAPLPVVTDKGVDWAAVAAFELPFVWLAGVVLMLTWIASRQAMFMGDVKRGLAGPAVVGFAKPRIVTPADFAERFSAEEQALILAHEAVHLKRGDARLNAAVALARCVCWFNPFVHIGARAMRIDQELSCDARVIEARPGLKRAYAETLVKTQLASRPLPMGAYWPPEHPLMRRVEMLARAGTVSRVRRMAGAGIVVTMLLGGSLAAWGLQPERPGPVVVREAQRTDANTQALPEQGAAASQSGTGELRPANVNAPPSGKSDAVQGPEVDYRKAIETARLGDAYLKSLQAMAPVNEYEAAATRGAVDSYSRIMEKLSGRMPQAGDAPDVYRELVRQRLADAKQAGAMIDALSPDVRGLLEPRPVIRYTPDGAILPSDYASAMLYLKARLDSVNRALANPQATDVQPAPAPQQQADPWLSPIRFSPETQQQARDAYYGIMARVTEIIRAEGNSPDAYAQAMSKLRADAKRAQEMIDGLSPEVRRYLDTHSEKMLMQERAFLEPGETSTLSLLKARLQDFNTVLTRMPATSPGPMPSGMIVPTPEEIARLAAQAHAEQDAKGYDRNKPVRIRGILKEVRIPEGGRALRVVDDRTGITWIADGPIVEGAEARRDLELRWGTYAGGRVVIEGWQSKDGSCAPECRMYHGMTIFAGGPGTAQPAPLEAKGYERGRAVTVQSILKSVKITPQGRELRFVDVGSGQAWVADGPVVESAEARAALEKDWGAHVGEYARIQGWQSNDGQCAPECRMYHGLIQFWNEKAAVAPGAPTRP
ncbi:MAG TPA: M56 family metallopeptidase [Hyphomonadaceae bacterium]|jgi:beta-lactamase regulating signal transducer with metallopeptidase domain|nr:M56 family metallopeptidase [Hyphomonadaceae bacterium]